MSTILRYTISPSDCAGHYFDVSLSFETTPKGLAPQGAGGGVELFLPAWIPGSYLVRDFAKHVMGMRAKVNGQTTPIEQTTKDSWLCAVPASETSAEQFVFDFDWRVYAWDLSVRGAHLDETHGFFNGTCVFFCPLGWEQAPIELDILVSVHKPCAGWLVACGLTGAQENACNANGLPVLTVDTPVRLFASNYDELIDHPVEMGILQTAHFEACGVKHHMVVYGADTDLNLQRICNDLQPVCEAQIMLFEPDTKRAPFSAYWFLVHATDKGYGGLEHRNSTALLCAQEDLPQVGIEKRPAEYETFLGLCSHEYFHAWNVKRMKPAAFIPYDLRRENYTQLLWVFEGFTSYYDDLMLIRGGTISEESYLKTLSKTVSQVLKNRGHLQQSVGESSLNAWTKYYRQDENSCNSVVSYYTKGALVALCLDAHIRKTSRGKKSLDDAMRLMWQRKGKGVEGLGEEEFALLVFEACGVDVTAQIKNWAYSCSPLPLEESLAIFGHELKPEDSNALRFVGTQHQFKPEGLLVKSVLNNSPAHKAGIAAGDLLVAVNERKITESRWKRILESPSELHQTIEVLGFRAERLMRFDLQPAPPLPQEWRIHKQESPEACALTPPWKVGGSK